MKSNFHLSVTIFLAFALGVTLTVLTQSRQATAYPAGPSISSGSNPTVSYGGTIYDYGNVLMLTAPADQDIVLTDIHLSAGEASSSCRGLAHITFVSGANVYAEFHIGLNRYGYDNSQYQNVIAARFDSGLRIPAGSNLAVDVAKLWDHNCSSGIDLAYTVTGYAAQP